jgi:hypothetical protein
MQLKLVLLVMLLLMIESPRRAIAQTSPPSSPAPAREKGLTAFLSRAELGEPENSFSTETPTIYLRWVSETLKTGETIRCTWIAEDVGKSAPANYHVDEASTKANESQTEGIFTLSKPKAGWPPGKYRAEIYVGTQLVEALPFTIEKLRGD